MQIVFKVNSSSKGAGASEFGIVVGLVAVVAIAGVFVTGETLKSTFASTDALLNDPLASSSRAGGSVPSGPPLPPPFNPADYGEEFTGWLMGTPGEDSLSIAGHSGVMALESDDTIVGDSGASVIIGAPGDDIITDPNGDDRYIYRSGDGSDTITEYYSGYDANGQNTLEMQGFERDDVMISRIDGTEDATLTFPDGSVITLLNGASGSYRHGINSFVFDDLVLRRQGIRDAIVEGQKASGSVVGSTARENYVYNDGDGSYTVYDYNQYEWQKSDTFSFVGLNADQVSLNAFGDDIMASTPSGDMIRLIDMRNNYGRMPPTWIFDDTTMSRRQFSSKLVEDQESSGSVLGSVAPEDYVYTLGDGSFSIDDWNQYDWQKADTFTFDNLSLDDVMLSADGNDMLATFSDDQVVRFVGARGGTNKMFPTWNFADATLDRAGMYSKITDDAKASGAVVGTTSRENYVHEAGDGSYTLYDWNRYDWQKSDTFTFIGFDIADATLSPSGNDFVITLSNGEVITHLGARTRSNEMVPTWNFDNGSLNRTQMYSKLVNDQKPSGSVYGTTYAENYFYQAGDGSFSVEDYNRYDWQKADTFTFSGYNQSDISMTRTGNNFELTVVPTGDTVTIVDGAGWMNEMIPSWIFADGSLSIQGIRNKSVRDQVLGGSGSVRATTFAEQFVHSEGEGNYTINNNATRYDWQQDDTFRFLDLLPGQVTITNSGGDMLLTTDGGDEIRFPSGASNGRFRVDRIIFSDGTVYDQATQASFL